MDYFTFDWAMGNESDVDAIGDYSRFLTSLDPAGAVWQFATTISLNDALLDKVVFNRSEGELKLLLLTGDLQVGYWRSELTYTGVTLHGERVLADALDRRPTEVWYDEFTCRGERLCHNFLLAPTDLGQATTGEFGIEFVSFSYTQEAVTSRTLATEHNTSVWR